jgi:hypothetical protein
MMQDAFDVKYTRHAFVSEGMQTRYHGWRKRPSIHSEPKSQCIIQTQRTLAVLIAIKFIRLITNPRAATASRTGARALALNSLQKMCKGVGHLHPAAGAVAGTKDAIISVLLDQGLRPFAWEQVPRDWAPSILRQPSCPSVVFRYHHR